MIDDEILPELLAVASQVSTQVPNLSWYGFGSFFRKNKVFSDVDVLVVCATDAQALTVREATKELCSRWPIHLVIMTEYEESETAFVGTESCRLLHISPPIA